MCKFKSVIWNNDHGIIEFYGINSHAEIACKLAERIGSVNAGKIEDNSIKFEIDITRGGSVTSITVDHCPDDRKNDLARAIEACKVFVHSHWPELWQEGLTEKCLTLPAISHKKRYGYRLAPALQKMIKNLRLRQQENQGKLTAMVLSGRIKLETAEKKLAISNIEQNKYNNKKKRLQKILYHVTSDIPVYGDIPARPLAWEIIGGEI